MDGFRFLSRLRKRVEGRKAAARGRATRSPGPSPSRRARLALEPLEDRCLLSSGPVISGFVYDDANNNGVFNAGEAVLANSTIQLLNSTGDVVGTALSDANGYYEFRTDQTVSTAPQTITHQLSFTEMPTDWTQIRSVPKFDASLGTLTSIEIRNADPITSIIKVENLDSSSATIHATVSGTLTLTGPGLAGLVTPLSADKTFQASAFDGVIDFGGTSGVDFGPTTATGVSTTTLTAASTLALYTGSATVSFTEKTQATSSASGSANLLVSIRTNASAEVTVIYHYTPSADLRPGAYTIVQTQQPSGYFDGLETRGNVAALAGTIGTDVITVNLGVADLGNNNFGELQPSSLAGLAYLDSNNNGLNDAGETGIAGVTISLTGTDALGAVSRSTITAANGSFQFANLRPGTYTIVETNPAGFLDGKDALGSAGGTKLNDQFRTIVLGPGEAGVDYNFGELLPSSLAGLAYADTNNDGVNDPAETGISGVTISLSGVNDLGQTVNFTTQTTGNGAYQFTDLRPGTYKLLETQPTTHLDGKEEVGALAGDVGPDRFSNIALASGVSGTGYNFGELVPASLAGFAYVDDDNDGIMDSSETGIGNVLVTLTGTTDLGTNVSLSQRTDDDGSYLFAGLRPGTYTVVETQPATHLDGKDRLGSAGGQLGSDRLANILLDPGANESGYNFGELQPASLAGLAYVDANNNGVKDAGETGIASVCIQLTGTDDLGNAVSLQRLTALNGAYCFKGLRPGSYTVTEKQPGAFLDGKDAAGAYGGLVSNDACSGIILASGDPAADYNFGELRGAKLSGFVYVDSNANGVRNSGEPGIAGVLLTLTGTDDLGNSVSLTRLSGTSGLYCFRNLRPGTYTITETQPQAFQDAQEQVGNSGGVALSDQIVNILLEAGFNGANYNFGERRTVTKRDFLAR